MNWWAVNSTVYVREELVRAMQAGEMDPRWHRYPRAMKWYRRWLDSYVTYVWRREE